MDEGLDKDAFRVAIVNRIKENVITHSKLHDILRRDNKYKLFLDIVKAVVYLHYGKEGIRAVDIHWESDSPEHFIREILRRGTNMLFRGINGLRHLEYKKFLKDPEKLINLLELNGDLQIFIKNFKMVFVDHRDFERLIVDGSFSSLGGKMGKAITRIYQILKEKKLI